MAGGKGIGEWQGGQGIGDWQGGRGAGPRVPSPRRISIIQPVWRIRVV